MKKEVKKEKNNSKKVPLELEILELEEKLAPACDAGKTIYEGGPGAEC